MKKTVLITGSSSRIGKAAATYFSEKGWNVAATMRKPEAEKDLRESANPLAHPAFCGEPHLHFLE